MRSSHPSRRIAGIILTVAALILSPAGVRVVSADEIQIADGPACFADAPPASQAQAARAIEEARRRAELRAEARSQEVIVLNNRGHNYGPPPTVDPRTLRLEQKLKARQN